MWKPSNKKERIIATIITLFISSFIQYLFEQYDTITTINAIIFLFVLLYIWIAKADDWVDEDKENSQGSLLDYFPNASARLNYLGGGLIKKPSKISVSVSNLGLTYGRHFIPLENIISSQIETQSQITSRITVTRMITLGIWSLAAPKRKKHNIQYLTIDYNLGMPSTLILEGKGIQKINAELLKAKTKRT